MTVINCRRADCAAVIYFVPERDHPNYCLDHAEEIRRAAGTHHEHEEQTRLTYRERRAARAERLRGWAEKREQRAAEVFAAGEPFTSDYAFNTQPGHIPFRARLIAREDRAHEWLAEAERLNRRADEIDRQADHAIYSDDTDAIERLHEKIAGLEAERARIVAYNKTARKGTPDRSLLDDDQREKLDGYLRFGFARGAAFPPHATSNLTGTIGQARKRLAQLTKERT